MLGRIVFSTLPALLVTLALFSLMITFIQTANQSLNDDDTRYVVDFVRLKRDETVKTKENKPDKPPQPQAPPPSQVTPEFDTPQLAENALNVAAVPVDNSLDISTGFGLSAADGDYLPIVKVQPIYPRRALSRGIEGYVILEFTVTKNGSVANPVVIESDPPRVFDSAAIKAALKFKYKPKIVNGDPVDVAGVQNKITFRLEK